MTKFRLLLNIFLKQSLRMGSNNKRSKKGKAGIIVSIILAVVFILPSLLVQVYVMGDMAINDGIQAQFISTIFLIIQGCSIVFGTIALSNALFFSKDNDILSTLPVTTVCIFFAKLTAVAIQEMLYIGIASYLALIMFGIMAKYAALYYLLALLGIILSTFFALLVTSFLLLPVMAITSFVKKREGLTSFVNLGAYLAGIVIYFFIVSKYSTLLATGDSNSISAVIKAIGGGLFFNFYLAEITTMSFTLNHVLVLLATYLGALLIAILLSFSIYKKAMQVNQEHGEGVISKESGEGSFKNNSVITALMKKDLKNIKRDSTLMFYCGVQILMAPIMIFLIFEMMYKELFDGETYVTMLSTLGVLFMVMFGIGTNYMASSSITRENKGFYIMKIIPVPYSMQIRAKVWLGYAVTVITTLLCAIVIIYLGLNILNVITITIGMLILGYGYVCWQVKLDLDKPRLNWSTVTEGLKNNSSSTITVLVAMVLGILYTALASLPKIARMLEINELWGTLVAFVIYVIFGSIFSLFKHKSLYDNVDKMMNKIEI